jgi:hypothetical protein
MTMNFARLFAVMIAFSTVSAHAALECSLVDDFDSWSVYVNDGYDTAIFFDNDHNTAMKRTGAEALECIGCPMNFTFTGNDEGLIEQFKVSVYSDRKTDAAAFVVEPGSKDEKEYAMTCRKMSKKDAAWVDFAEAKKAIEEAGRNEGSTRY